MSTYLHGAYGSIGAAGTKEAAQSMNAIVYIGTAPVHTTPGGAARVNTPVLLNNMADARRYLGYSADWDKYTLCEAMYVHFELNNVGPLVMINVLDPAAHKADEGGSVTQKPVNGRVMIANAGDIVLDSVKVTGLTAGTDYTLAYDHAKECLIITEAVSGTFGSDTMTITYDTVDPEKVDAADVIGTSDGEGMNTGLHALANVYQTTGFIPSHLLAPKFSSDPEVHAAMIRLANKVNAHWDVYVRADIPLEDADGEKITLSGAREWKDEHGYNQSNETVYFPMVMGTDDRIYHISVLAAANLEKLLSTQDGIPYKTPSNTECSIIRNLYMGEDSVNRVYDDELINQQLNRYGIASAAYAGGRWVIWGFHSADYTADTGDLINIAETNRMMLYYVSNDFQHRRIRDVDKPMTINDLRTIVAQEQARLDALVKIGALIYGKVNLDASTISRSDIVNGDFSFTFDITTTPQAKSLKVIVNWTDVGYMTYYEGVA